MFELWVFVFHSETARIHTVQECLRSTPNNGNHKQPEIEMRIMGLKTKEEPSVEVGKISQLLLALNLDGEISIEKHKSFEKTLGEFFSPDHDLKKEPTLKQQESAKLGKKTRKEKHDSSIKRENVISEVENTTVLSTKKEKCKPLIKEFETKEIHFNEKQKSLINHFLKNKAKCLQAKQKSELDKKQEDLKNISETDCLLRERGVTKPNKTVNDNPDQKLNRLSGCISVERSSSRCISQSTCTDSAPPSTLPPSPSSGYGSPMSSVFTPLSFTSSPLQIQAENLDESLDLGISDCFSDIINDESFSFLDVFNFKLDEKVHSYDGKDSPVPITNDMSEANFSRNDSGYGSPYTHNIETPVVDPSSYTYAHTLQPNFRDISENSTSFGNRNLLNPAPSDIPVLETISQALCIAHNGSKTSLESPQVNFACTSLTRSTCGVSDERALPYSNVQLVQGPYLKPQVATPNQCRLFPEKPYDKQMMSQFCPNNASNIQASKSQIIIIQQPIFLVNVAPTSSKNTCSGNSNGRTKTQNSKKTKNKAQARNVPILSKDKFNPAKQGLVQILNRETTAIYLKTIYNEVRMCDKYSQDNRHNFKVIYVVDNDTSQTNLHKAIMKRQHELVFALVEIQRQYEEEKLAKAVSQRDKWKKRAQDYIAENDSPDSIIVYDYLDCYSRN